MAGCCEHGNEPSGSIKESEFLEGLSDYISFTTRNLPHTVGWLVKRFEAFTTLKIRVLLVTTQKKST
jgi:hypothetical protein